MNSDYVDLMETRKPKKRISHAASNCLIFVRYKVVLIHGCYLYMVHSLVSLDGYHEILFRILIGFGLGVSK